MQNAKCRMPNEKSLWKSRGEHRLRILSGENENTTKEFFGGVFCWRRLSKASLV